MSHSKAKKGLFLQCEAGHFIGSMHISSALKEAGHDCDLLVLLKEKNVLKKINKINPDFILVTLMSTDVEDILKLLDKIKKTMDVTTVIGGIHPTIYPEFIKEPSVDIICVGEGERAIVDIFNGKNLSKIGNISFKKNDKPKHNKLDELLDVNAVPFPDRRLYYRYPQIMKKGAFMASRGCPFRCSYCFNHQLQNLFKGKGRYVRMKTPENIIKEIEEARKIVPFKKIIFGDDALDKDKRWFKKFAELYKKRINVPYTCNLRLDLITEEFAAMLRDSGCYGARVGLETGNEELRAKVLKRPMKNKAIINGAKILHKYNIPFQTNNILGLPDETIRNAFETVFLNIKIKPSYVWCSLLVPYPHSDIYNYALKRGYIESEASDFPYEERKVINDFSFHGQSYLNMKDIQQLNNLHKFFYLAVKYPFLLRTIRKLIRLPPNKLFSVIFYIGYGMRYYGIYKPSILSMASRGTSHLIYKFKKR